MDVIRKYNLENILPPNFAHADQTIDMPYSAKIVHVGIKCDEIGEKSTRGDKLTIWAEVSDHVANETRTFRPICDGQEVPIGYKYVGTAQAMDYCFVWHLYEKTK